MKAKSTTWHEAMYDDWLIRRTIGSDSAANEADEEIAALLSALGPRGVKRWLDVPCGTGRHCRALARNGMSVTGMDINVRCVEIANELGGGVAYRVGDMKALDIEPGTFDVVSNLGSSFGYFDSPEEDLAVLRGLADCLVPGGSFAMHLLDRDVYLSNFEPCARADNDVEQTIELRHYSEVDQTVSVISARRCVEMTRWQTLHHRLRLYSGADIARIFADAGLSHFRSVSLFGGRRRLYLGRKAKP
jgi:SAM-dependent methyltransferase